MLSEATGWWARMLTVHLFARVFVLVGDAPAHDFHHRHPGSKKWQNYIYERHKDAVEGCRRYPVNYSECWGLFAAIDQTLVSFAAAKEMEFSESQKKEASLSELLHAQRA